MTSNVNDWFPPSGGYKPISNSEQRSSETPLPPIPKGGSGESGRTGDKVCERCGKVFYLVTHIEHVEKGDD